MSKGDHVQNPLPSWLKEIAPAPIALLHSYKALGMNDGELIYVLQILSDYVSGKVPNQGRIAARMGRASGRTLRQYNQHLVAIGLARIIPRFVGGAQVENGYDFTPLFEACLENYESEQQQELARLGSIDQLLSEIIEAHDKGEELQPLLDQLFRLRSRTPPDPTILPPRIVGSSPPRITGSSPPGSQDPGGYSTDPPDPTILPIDDDGDQRSNASNDQRSSSSDQNGNGKNVLQRLMAFGYDHGAAVSVFWEARQVYGDDATEALEAWLDYYDRQPKGRFTNVLGLFRSKVRGGGPPPAAPAQSRDNYQIPDEYQDIIKR